MQKLMRVTFPSRSTSIGRLMVIVLLMGTSVLNFRAINAQEYEYFNYAKRATYGAFGSLNVNRHNAKFVSLPDLNACCNEFGTGSGQGVAVGVMYELPLAPKLWLDLRFGLFSYAGTVTSQESDSTIINGVPRQIEFERQLETNLAPLMMQAAAGYKLVGNLGVLLGFQFGLITLNDYDQKDILTTPTSEMALGDEPSVRNGFSSSIPRQRDVQYMLTAGLAYEIALDEESNVFLQPEIFYSHGISSIVKERDWKVNSLRLGAALKIVPKKFRLPSPDLERTVPLPQSLPLSEEEPQDDLFAAVTAYGVTRDGARADEVRLHVEEFLSTSLRPLLHFVFFDENSALLPDRYVQLRPSQTQSFTPDNFNPAGELDHYYNILNVVGARMRLNPEYTLHLIGCTSGAGHESGDTSLARTRAETVRDYLLNIWKIEEHRLALDARDLPENFTNTDRAEAPSENRRVELIPNDWELFKPVAVHDTTRVVNPPQVVFSPLVQERGDIAGWEIAAYQGTKVLKKLSGRGSLPDSIDWFIDLEKLSIPVSEDPLRYTLTLKDKAGRRFTSTTGAIPVQQLTIAKKRREKVDDSEIDRYSLLLFNFDRAEIDEKNQSIMDYIQQRIRSDASVRITGYTDRVGDDRYNQALSSQRARSVSRMLQTAGRLERATGVGESVLLFDNDVPEGRFYCRTVNVIVKTPLSEQPE